MVWAEDEGVRSRIDYLISPLLSFDISYPSHCCSRRVRILPVRVRIRIGFRIRYRTPIGPRSNIHARPLPSIFTAKVPTACAWIGNSSMQRGRFLGLHPNQIMAIGKKEIEYVEVIGHLRVHRRPGRGGSQAEYLASKQPSGTA